MMKFYNGSFDCLKRQLSVLNRFVDGYRSAGIPLSFNPFENLIIAPLFYSQRLLEFYKCWRIGEFAFPLQVSSVIMDSGGYQVQTGKISFEALLVRLKRIWESESWADFYVLPDHVPRTSDLDFEVQRKVDETLKAGEKFLSYLPSGKTAIGVVHGRNLSQVLGCLRRWKELGVSYVAFGSFGTSGPYGGVNLISHRSLRLLKSIFEESKSFGMKLHVFGIGHPSYIRLLAQNGIYPDSVDSLGWFKAGKYWQIFFDNRPQRFVCPELLGQIKRKSRKAVMSFEEIQVEKKLTNHECPFCRDVRALSDSTNLALHNLVVTVDTILRVRYDYANGS